MKVFLVFSLVFYTVNGFRFSNIFSNHEEISPFASCTGVESGTRLPHDTECGKFILCDSGMGLTLSCRSTDPHFNRCTSACVNDPSVCGVTSCPGETTTTGTTTTSTGTTTSTTTTTGSTTTSTTTTTTPTTTTPTTTVSTTTAQTTTRFNPPTVPIKCDTPCDFADTDCTCNEQMTCLPGNVCICDVTKMCPVNLVTCSLPANCGCESNCICSDVPTNSSCTCRGDSSICFFDRETQCVERCGCDSRCDTSVCEESTTTPGKYLCSGCNKDKSCPFKKEECLAQCGCTRNCDCDITGTVCTCFPNSQCKCLTATDCPFESTDCITKCTCTDRCKCNGPFCRCDPDAECPAATLDSVLFKLMH